MDDQLDPGFGGRSKLHQAWKDAVELEAEADGMEGLPGIGGSGGEVASRAAGVGQWSVGEVAGGLDLRSILQIEDEERRRRTLMESFHAYAEPVYAQYAALLRDPSVGLEDKEKFVALTLEVLRHSDRQADVLAALKVIQTTYGHKETVVRFKDYHDDRLREQVLEAEAQVKVLESQGPSGDEG